MLDLICIDVDGTLVGTSGEPLPMVWAAAERAIARGQHLAICTGRPAFGKALAFAQRLDPKGWHIFQSGSSILHAESGQTLSTPLGTETLAALQAQADQHGWILEVYTDLEWAVDSDHRFAQDHAKLLGVPFERRHPNTLNGTVVRAQWVVPIEETDTVLAERLPHLEYHPAGSPVMPGVMFISVTRNGIDKGSAIRTIAQKLSTTLDRVMMVGDAHNDVVALKTVGHAVAMGNADHHARAVSKYVVGDVNAGGLAEALDMSADL